MKIKELLTEAPYLNHEELPYKALSSISLQRIKKSYKKIGALKPGFDIYLNLSSGSIQAGKAVGAEFYPAVAISTRKVPYPVEPTGLDDVLQVAMVNVADGMELSGLTKKVYNLVGSLFDLVSDQEQYLGAQGLWKSLARSSDINVYVFDGKQQDYIRDADGVALRYNGSNIPARKIWGTTVSHRMTLLVGTKKVL